MNCSLNDLKKYIPGTFLKIESWAIIYLSLVLLYERDLFCSHIATAFESINSAITGILTQRQALGVITAIFIALSFARFTLRELHNRHITILEIATPIVIWAYTAWEGWNFVNIIGDFSFKNEIILCSAIWLGIVSYRLLMLLQTSGPIPDTVDTSEAPSGYETDTAINYQDGRKEYAKVVAAKLKHNRIGNESFALGINGEWGSGKTRFLSYLEQELAEDYIIIKFNPWECLTPNKLLEHFFRRIESSLYRYNHDLSQKIKQYGLSLVREEYSGIFHNSVRNITEHIFQPDKSLKEQIEDTIVSLEKPVLILIDDIDRLDASELFETLRLIRNTCNFKNLTYIVAYDKRYVVNMLHSKGIANPDIYLEKIFNSEIWLPSFEPVYLLKEIYNRIKNAATTLPRRKLLELGWSILTKENNTYILPKYIANYRQAVRFSNMFISDLENMIINSTFSNLNISDFFWIEVLKYISLTDYCTLRDSPTALLENKHRDGCGLYELRKDIPDDIQYLTILRQIFAKKEYNVHDMAFHENYNTYFSLRILSTNISNAEFRKALEAADDASIAHLRIWSDTRPSLTESVRFHFINFGFQNATKAELTAVIKMLLRWLSLSNDKELLGLLRSRIAPIQAQFPQDELDNLIDSTIREHFDFRALNWQFASSLISSLAPEDQLEWEEGIYKNGVVSDSVIKQLAWNIFDTRYPAITADDFVGKNSEAVRFMSNIGILSQSYHYNGYNEITEYDHLIWDKIIDSISARGRSKNLASFTESWRLSDEDEEYVVAHPEIQCDHFNHIYQVFSNRATLKKFIYSCFEGSDAEKEQTLRRIL